MGDRARRSRWAALGAAVAVTLGAGGVSWVGATISSGSKAVYVSISPCRLVDTRPGGPGTRDAPLTAGETATFNVHGTNGDCTIPAGATAITGNATITDPTDDGFMTIAPTGGVGTSSNLNWLVGQSPTPNAFTTALSGDGRIDVRNDRGTVNVILDITGYYEDHTHDDRYYTKTEIDQSGANAIRAAGEVTASGGPVGHFTIGTYTTSLLSPGNYLIRVPGLLPGCSSPDWPLIMASSSDGTRTQIDAEPYQCFIASGDVTFLVKTWLDSTATNRSFTFVVYASAPNGGLAPADTAGDGVCTRQEDDSILCD